MKKLKRILPFLMFTLVIAGFAGTPGLVKAQDGETDTIPDKVFIGDISVGKMTEDEATKAVQANVDAIMKLKFTLKAGGKEVSVTAKDLGVEWSNTTVVAEASHIGKYGNLIERYKAKKDLENDNKVYPMEYSVDEEKAAACLNKNAAALNQAAVNNGLKRENNAFAIIAGQEGVAVDTATAVSDVKKFFANNWNGQAGSIELTAKVVKPEGSKEDLNKVKDLLGGFSTDFSDSAAGRIANVKNAASKVNGHVIYPGEEFSVYNAIGPLEANNGYELAGSYENGTTVESYGGGVCQVSTTLYNAVIRAELGITQRSNHSMLVTYVEPSMDAAIAGTYKDLKFKNTTDAPIYLEGYTSGKKLFFNVYGHETRDNNRKVTFQSETTNEEQPTVQIVATANPIGTVVVSQKAHIGKSAQLWKIVTVNGVETSREIFNQSKYSAAPKIVSVGTASDNAEAVAAMNAAIATQDESTISAAAAQWCTDAIAARQAQAAADAAAAAQAASEAAVVGDGVNTKPSNTNKPSTQPDNGTKPKDTPKTAGPTSAQ
jgi:vancomycin resistance protein YoaR